jgi:hypothetical protein
MEFTLQRSLTRMLFISAVAVVGTVISSLCKSVSRILVFLMTAGLERERMLTVWSVCTDTSVIKTVCNDTSLI